MFMYQSALCSEMFGEGERDNEKVTKPSKAWCTRDCVWLDWTFGPTRALVANGVWSVVARAYGVKKELGSGDIGTDEVVQIDLIGVVVAHNSVAQF